MSWNHRILLSPDGKTYTLYDVYYDEHGKPDGWSRWPSVFLSEEGPEAIIKQLELALERAKLPVLQIPADDSGELKEVKRSEVT